ncbi:MAG: D-aminoacylase [Firmicutes bacterium]|jgi:N-acyl-D-aspartate/D-glutamate deacylase|nr:D-aminoacylase [Bacillota bacterium]
MVHCLDVLLVGGYVVDGTGVPWYRADVAVRDGVVVLIAPKIDLPAARTLDVHGMVVAPGFIDIHSHSDYSFFWDPDASQRITQGFTTEICGNCGVSAAPIRERRFSDLQLDLLSSVGVRENVTWCTFREYLQTAASQKMCTNVGVLIGYNTIREYVAGTQRELSTAERLEIMELVTDAMAAGALGVSSGLVYQPGNFASRDELTEACRIVARWGGVYATHTRGLRESFSTGVGEAIDIAQTARVPLEISHMVPQLGGWGQWREALDQVDEARARGVDVTFDTHLDTVGGNNVLATIPPQYKQDGVESLAARLSDPGFRSRLRRDMQDFLGPGTSGHLKHSRWDILRIGQAPYTPWAVGKSVEALSWAAGKDPWDVFFDLLEANGRGLYLTAVYVPEDAIRSALSHPASMVMTDASFAEAGPNCPFPRNFGTSGKLLGKYVREEGLLSLEEAVRKITSAPAARYGLWDRGVLRPGFAADVTVFDPATIAPTVTDEGCLAGCEYQNPRTVGVMHVLVNGEVVLEGGELTGARPGRLLLRRHT